MKKSILMITVFFSMNTLSFPKDMTSPNYDRIDLIYAAKDKNYDGAKYLLDAGVYPDTRENAGNTALMFASLNGDLNIVKLLLDSDAFTNAKNNTGRSALNYAVSNKTYNIEVIKLLLENGALIDNQSWTKVIQYNDVELAKLLLDHGSDENTQNRGAYYDSALFLVIEHDSILLVALLLGYGADPNNALRHAVKHNKIKIVELLIENEADVNYVNSEGESILQYAIDSKNKDIVKLLEYSGAVIKSKFRVSN